MQQGQTSTQAWTACRALQAPPLRGHHSLGRAQGVTRPPQRAGMSLLSVWVLCLWGLGCYPSSCAATTGVVLSGCSVLGCHCLHAKAPAMSALRRSFFFLSLSCFLKWTVAGAAWRYGRICTESCLGRLGLTNAKDLHYA